MGHTNVLAKPIERIQETCEMMGIADEFERARPGLESFLNAEVSNGETNETRLTFDGLRYLKKVLPRPSNRGFQYLGTSMSRRS